MSDAGTGRAWESGARRAQPPEAGSSARRMTQRDVALAAGLHASTVSLALRGSKRVAATTRERVSRIAASIGFAPDPLMQAFVAHRERAFARTARETIAFVAEHPLTPAARRCAEGARACAGELGFSFELHALGAPGPSARRLGQILFHRGIGGVILHHEDGGTIEWRALDLERLSVVAIGTGERVPPVHRAEPDHAGNLQVAVRHAARAGFRRIGIVVTPDWRLAHARAFAGLASEQASVVGTFRLAGERPPVMEDAGSDVHEAARFERWLAAERPDVVLAPLRRVQAYLARRGDAWMEGVAVFDLDLDEAADEAGAGISQNHGAVGAVAMRLLARELLRNARGLPPIPTRTLVPGAWRAGRLSVGAMGEGNTGADRVSSSVYCCHNSAAGG